ncbi:MULTISPECIES: glutaredoxin 2 [unclassified Pantoea]|uniref:glutaredoxin 2 n=1 Tax=unclassified Pantoea TaxID=2630326 RepID=UPI001CD5AB21|nr:MULTISPECIES: glutaredoxin 2 [unclassified Pantoea]MCA1178628.1 glutaredoxin 2 [Pantoea sp. alder69]MCA1252046.1 glutaredoxin 2 [Pantoea sp. alder70]MCA1267117.1 glutaredoxin 2 [Pantoea sp. alder81]
MKLYVYDHCPFCVRSRMIFGLKDVACEIIALPNDDEETPTRLIGKKMLPVLVTESNEAIGESLDIVKYIDENYGASVLTVTDDPAIEAWMEEATKVIYPLAIPRWASADFEEFRQDAARKYFVSKKEAVFGPFPRLLEQTETMVTEINAKLEILEVLLSQKEKETGHFSLTDIRLFPLLRSLSIVKDIKWPLMVDAWRKEMAVKSQVNLNDDIAI